jgi:hypothetical protein
MGDRPSVDHVRSVCVHGSVPKWFRWTDSGLVQMGDRQFRMIINHQIKPLNISTWGAHLERSATLRRPAVPVYGPMIR